MADPDSTASIVNNQAIDTNAKISLGTCLCDYHRQM